MFLSFASPSKIVFLIASDSCSALISPSMRVLAAPASSPSAPKAAEAGRSAPVKPSPMATDMREKAVVAGAVFCAASLTLSESFLRSGVTEPTAPRTLARPSSKSSVSALKRIVTSSAMYGFSLI